MLKGYTVPLSPFGKASLNPLPPWHYSGDVLGAEFWADPAAVAATLPPGVNPDPATAGHGLIMFVDWQFTAADDELLDPARYQYREFFVLLDASFKGTPIAYCPYIYVDNDAALARGWVQGFPKKLASVYQTRSFAAPSLAAAPLASGTRFGASASAHGERFAQVRVTLRQQVSDPMTMLTRPTAMRRYFPKLSGRQYDKAPVDELVISLTDNLALADAWTGDAEILFPETQGEEMHALGPVKVGMGFRFSMAYTVTDLKVLEDFTLTR